MGIRVVGADRISLPVGSALVRVLGDYVWGLLLRIGYLWMLWAGNNQTLHAKMAGSIVVKL